MGRTRLFLALIWTVLLVALFAAGCSSDDDGDAGTGAPAAASDQAEGGGDATPAATDSGQAVQQETEASIVFTSPVFNEKRRIPKKHTCTQISANVPNISPPLGWEGVPDGAVSLALIMDSLEIEGAERVHWVVWNMPPSAHRAGGGRRALRRAGGRHGPGNQRQWRGRLSRPLSPGHRPGGRGDAVEDPDAGRREEGHRAVFLQALRAGRDARAAAIDHEGGPADGH